MAAQSHSAPGRVMTVRLKINAFVVTQLPAVPFYHYDVDIKPKGITTLDKPISKQRLQDIMDRFSHAHAGRVTKPIAYDGRKSMYTADSSLEGSFDVDMAGAPATQAQAAAPHRPRIFTIKLTPVAKIDPSTLSELVTARQQGQSPRALTVISLLQHLIHSAPKQQAEAANARSVYMRSTYQDLGRGLQLWRGFFHSVRPTLGKVLINIDTTTTAVINPGNIYEVALQHLGREPRNTRAISKLSREDFFKLRSFFKKVNVMVKIPGGKRDNHARPIKDLVENAGAFRFQLRDGEEKTVEQYFFDTHNYRLHFASGFGVRIGKDAVIPGEVVEIAPNQIYKKKIPNELMSGVLKFAEMKPEQKLRQIQGALQPGQSLDYRQSKWLQDAGMKIDPRAIEAKAASFPVPAIEYAGNVQARPSGGSWNLVSRERRTTFFEPGRIEKWAVIDFAPQSNAGSINEVIRKLDTNMRNLGITILSQPSLIRGNGQQVDIALREALSACGCHKPGDPVPSLIVVILPFPAPDIRRQVKHLADTRYEVPTQCMINEKWSRGTDQYVNNVALKINAKIGGRNSIPTDPIFMKIFLGKPVMVMGADVSHPGPGVHSRPSIASLVWSINSPPVRYGTATSVQEPRTEVIAGLQSMTAKALESWGRFNKDPFPLAIIMYRDGVSEGEYDRVQREECGAIEKAIEGEYIRRGKPPGVTKPLIVFIVVGKRHHIRFFPSEHTNDRSGNCPPGVAVFKELQSPYAQDWYLLSQGGLKGTSVPAHYILLRNDQSDNFKYSAEELAQLSYTLCYTFARATRSVSIPAPVYYADLACERAQFHFRDELHYEDETSTSTSSTFDLHRWTSGFKQLSPRMAHSFWFL